MLNTVIFDMDGLLIDSEPLWEEAGKELLRRFNVQLTPQQYHSSTGLGTSTWIEHWFNHFNIDQAHAADAATSIVASAIQKIEARALPMPGVGYILGFFKQRGFKIGLASSSPMRLIDSVVRKLGIESHIEAKASAENLPYSKPHPQVFLDCAASLGSAPQHCICFEDSFNGMIAAKAARMKCVVVPAYAQQQDPRWAAADLKLSSLQNFNELLLQTLG